MESLITGSYGELLQIYDIEVGLDTFTSRTTDGDQIIQRIRVAGTLHNSKQDPERPFCG